ncbi:putative endopeptidase [Nonlabens sp. Hel1_33_55]|uniref:M13 family metallopeptidase n=1 Tax=Nonlabens sp. Hel1_33_55 TaxID=1336802 RepID=UPI000875E781|nr:M13 family metallopeptidase [Nonlabens sp. Hel1_33_55]SCY04289.1 putative endopeptidase [Nonlabens sp. Hel1_33_55]
MNKIIYLISILALSASCKSDTSTDPTPFPEKDRTVVFDGINDSIAPGDNFYDHVNKTWYENTPIADDHVGVGAYRFLNIPQQELLLGILQDVAKEDFEKGTVEQQVGVFYASGMDTTRINQRGSKPIEPLLKQIDGIKDNGELLDYVIQQLKVSDNSIIGPYISPDQKNSELNILHFAQTGLGLPDRDYYFAEDPSVAQIQEAYQTYLTTLFELVGEDDAFAKAEKVYSIEKQLAQSHKTRVERRVVSKNYHMTAVTDLQKQQPNIGWNSMLEKLGTKVDSVDIAQTEYYTKLNSLLAKIPIEDWKLYVKANTISAHADLLSKPFQDAEFAYSKVLSGQSQQQPREKLMTRRVDNQLGFALGQLYVKRHFNEDAKARALDLVNNFQKTLEKRINALDWMSDSTKVKAVDKLYAINKKIGYPDAWRTYDVTMDREKFFENVVALRLDEYEYELAKLNKAPNRDEWYTTPSTVTAYYNPSANEIVFPAGILQAPYFDLYADDAVNYGGIGMVIGHEFTHAFDDQGAQYDKDGNVSNWWTEDDYTKFKAKTQQIIDQYGEFTVLDSLHLNGALTVGENTADNGGIAIAYDAFQLTDQGKGDEQIGGYTPEQRFFLSIARIWRVKMRDEFLRNYVTTDPHSPPQWRVNGPLMNFTPFYEAFDVKEGEANYKTEEERIKIW